jgi:hypothetical protein
LHRWTQILATSYALPQLLALQGCSKERILAEMAPWRRHQPVTAGRIRRGLEQIFRHVDIRAHWNAKSGKFGLQKCAPRADRPPDRQESA